MASVNVDISSALLGTKFAVSSKFFPSARPQISSVPKRRNRLPRISSRLGGEEADDKKADKKKFITRKQEPEQYWQSAGERAGENPMKTPLPYIIIFGMSTPFIILAVAFANGWIKVPIR